jgi:aryl-phospho-beta-D-glucosidase BglC (GH1 family)
MKKLAFPRLITLSLATCLGLAAQAQTSDDTLAFKRAQRLQHGINASIWFAQSPGNYSVERLRSFTTSDDIALIHQLGFDHVRLSIDADPLLPWLRNPEVPTPFVTELDRTVKTILDQQLAVIIDIHPESHYKAELLIGTEGVEHFAGLWRALAKHFATTDPDLVFFEIMNEPEQDDSYRWQGIESFVADRFASQRQTTPSSSPAHTGLDSRI